MTIDQSQLTVDEAANYVRLSKAHLAKLRVRGDGPAFLKLGHRSVTYDVRDLDAWLASKRRTSTSDTGVAA